MTNLATILAKNVKINKEWLTICQNRLDNAAFFEGCRKVEELERDVREARYTLEVSKCQYKIEVESEKLAYLRNNRS